MRLRTEEDFQIMLEEFGDKRSIKIYVKEDLDSTTQTMSTTVDNLEIYYSKQLDDDAFGQQPVIIEEEKESSLESEQHPIHNKDALIEEISVLPPKVVEQTLSLMTWDKQLTDALTYDNPNEVLWTLKKAVQLHINSLRQALPAQERRKSYHNHNWKQFRLEGKILQEKQDASPLPKSINFDDIKE